jgi:hypothetical protein
VGGVGDTWGLCGPVAYLRRLAGGSGGDGDAVRVVLDVVTRFPAAGSSGAASPIMGRATVVVETPSRSLASMVFLWISEGFSPGSSIIIIGDPWRGGGSCDEVVRLFGDDDIVV